MNAIEISSEKKETIPMGNLDLLKEVINGKSLGKYNRLYFSS